MADYLEYTVYVVYAYAPNITDDKRTWTGNNATEAEATRQAYISLYPGCTIRLDKCTYYTPKSLQQSPAKERTPML